METSGNIGEALSRLHEAASRQGRTHIFHTGELDRKDRELLLAVGWLQEITRGWYLLTRPDLRSGDSSGWYANFWDFLFRYLTHFYGDEYCLSAEHSLDLHIGSTVIPKQVVVMAPKGRGAPLGLLYETSLLVYQSAELPHAREVVRQLQVMSLPYALCKITPTFFRHQPLEAEIALALVDSVDLLRTIAEHHFVAAAAVLQKWVRSGDPKTC